MMKKLIGLIIFMTFPLTAFAANVLTEDWDTFNISNYYDTGDALAADVNTTKPYTGTKSLQLPFSGGTGGTYAKRSFTAIPASTWVWTTYYLWLPSGYAPGGYLHLVSLDFSSEYIQLDFRGDTLTLIAWNDKDISMDSARAVSFFQNRWTKVQMGVQHSTRAVQIWVDDVKVYDHTAVGDLSTNRQIDNINIRCHEVTTVNNGILYIDDVSVDTVDRPTTGSPPAVPNLTGVTLGGGQVK
jgi:hypothetical protein